jgi:LAO/AO transport system kinase
VNKIKEHFYYLKESGKFEERRKNNLKLEVVELIEEQLRKIVISHTDSENKLDDEIIEIFNKNKNAYEVRDRFLEEINGK